jgi:hypothetical protein
MRSLRWLLLVVLLAPALALANGLTAHVWISQRAVELLPPGPLRDLLSRGDLRSHLVNGTLFPDGGYAMKAAYGEASHWDPFRHTLRANLPPRAWDQETERKVAFLFGLASHGLADEFHDATFMERSKQVDRWTNADLDMAADVVFAYEGHKQGPPGPWLPSDAVIAALKQSDGLDVAAATLLSGQTLTQGALTGVSALALTPFATWRYRSQFPWAMANISSKTTLGAPESEAQLVALYWQQLWERLNGLGPIIDRPLLASFPAAESTGHPVDASSVDSRVVLVFREGMKASSIRPDTVKLLDAGGKGLPVDLQLFYGDHPSHTLLIKPRASLPRDQWLTVVLPAFGVQSGEGVSPAFETRFRFKTQH